MSIYETNKQPRQASHNESEALHSQGDVDTFPSASFNDRTAEPFAYSAELGTLPLRVAEEKGAWGKDKTEQTRQKVETGLADLAESLSKGKSDRFLELLTCMSRFHRYSWGNTILIALQRPAATIVAGFTTWQGLERQVKTGEKGIAILAPVSKRAPTQTPVRQTAAASADLDTESEPDQPGNTNTLGPDASARVRGFRVVHVFDIEQTEGKALPEFAIVKGDPRHYLARLQETIKEAAISLEYQDELGGAFGRSFGGRIAVKRGMSPAQDFATLLHEFAHELLHTSAERSLLSKTVKETEAEAVAFVVGQAVGLEPGTASSDDIQLYQGDTETLARSLERIQKTAHQILASLESDPQD